MMRLTRFDSSAAIAHGDGEIGLARSRRTDAEHHVVLLDGLDVAALVDALGLHGALAEGTLLAGFGEPAQGRGRIGSQDADHRSEVAVDEGEAIAQQVLVIGKDLLGAAHIAGCSCDLDGIGLHGDGDVQAIFQQAQVFVAGAE